LWRLERLFRSNRRYFGKKILDIGCGGGVLGFIVERKGCEYLGIDANPDMIKDARGWARRLNSKNTFILGDATKASIRGTFDTITLLGNGLCHYTTHDFVALLRNLQSAAHQDTYFIVDYRDVVELLFDKEWKDKMIERRRGKRIVSLTLGCDTRAGEIRKRAFESGGKNPVKFAHAIWSPFIIEPLMESNGWKLVKRARGSGQRSWLDVYRKQAAPEQPRS